MGREVRMVPKNWEHPKNSRGQYIALHDGIDLEEAISEWATECNKWNSGVFPDYASQEDRLMSYSEWAGERPDPDCYMPIFAPNDAICVMMYETTSEGTPISPAFATPEELATWLFKNNASAFGRQTASYEGWLRVAKGGYAPSAVMSSSGGLQSGVDALA